MFADNPAINNGVESIGKNSPPMSLLQSSGGVPPGGRVVPGGQGSTVTTNLARTAASTALLFAGIVSEVFGKDAPYLGFFVIGIIVTLILVLNRNKLQIQWNQNT